MSADKLQAVHEAFANAFNESRLNAADTERLHPAFDHEAFSEVFSEPYLNSAHSELPPPIFDHVFLAGAFSEAIPASTNSKPPRTSFDHHSLAEVLSEPFPFDEAEPSQPGFDHRALVAILNRPQSTSVDTKPLPPNFDQQALAEILGERRPTSSTAEPSPASLHDQALPETLSELRPVPISPQLSPRSLDAGSSSTTLPRQLNDEEPTAKPVAAAPSTIAETAPPQRAKSLLIKLHHIFSIKAGSLPASGKKGLPPAPLIATPTASSTHTKATAPRHLEPLMAEVSLLVPTSPEMRPSNFEEESSSSGLSGQPGSVRRAASDVAAVSVAETTSAQPLRATSSLISANTEESPPILEKNTPAASFASDPYKVDPEVKALAAPADCDEAESLLTELRPSTSASTEPLRSAEQKSSRLTPPGQISNAEPAATLIAAAPPIYAEKAPPLAESVGNISAHPRPPLPITVQELSRPTSSNQSANREPAVKTFSVSPSTEAESAVTPWKASLRAVVPSDSSKPQPPPHVFEHAPSPVPASGQPHQPEPPANIFAANPRAEAKALEPQHGNSRLAEIRPSRFFFERGRSTKPLSCKLDTLAPMVKTVRPDTSINAEVTQPQQMKSPTDLPALVSSDAGPSPPINEANSALPSLTDQLYSLDPTTKAVAVAPPVDAEGAVTRAQQAQSLLAQLDLSTAIRLRWVMRDIRSNRTKLSPVSDNDQKTLMNLGLVEIRQELLRLTALGVLALD